MLEKARKWFESLPWVWIAAVCCLITMLLAFMMLLLPEETRSNLLSVWSMLSVWHFLVWLVGFSLFLFGVWKVNQLFLVNPILERESRENARLADSIGLCSATLMSLPFLNIHLQAMRLCGLPEKDHHYRNLSTCLQTLMFQVGKLLVLTNLDDHSTFYKKAEVEILEIAQKAVDLRDQDRAIALKRGQVTVTYDFTPSELARTIGFGWLL